MPPIPPLPTPFPVPPPGSSGLDFTQLWNVENYSRMISILQSVLILANQNLVISAFVVLSIIAMTFYALSRVLGHSGAMPDDGQGNRQAAYGRRGRQTARIERTV